MSSSHWNSKIDDKTNISFSLNNTEGRILISINRIYYIQSYISCRGVKDAEKLLKILDETSKGVKKAIKIMKAERARRYEKPKDP